MPARSEVAQRQTGGGAARLTPRADATAVAEWGSGAGSGDVEGGPQAGGVSGDRPTLGPAGRGEADGPRGYRITQQRARGAAKEARARAQEVPGTGGPAADGHFPGRIVLLGILPVCATFVGFSVFLTSERVPPVEAVCANLKPG